MLIWCKPIATPLVIIAHSLGGLVVKQVMFYKMTYHMQDIVSDLRLGYNETRPRR